jgi:hypothetical protein
MANSTIKNLRHKRRYGIGEWYGHSLVHLDPLTRRQLGQREISGRGKGDQLPCIPRSTPEQVVPCTKVGGVCSLRLYEQNSETLEVSPATGDDGLLRTICPNRFLEDARIFEWIGGEMLGHPAPAIAREVKFLERPYSSGIEEQEERREDVGRIDNILVHPNAAKFHWCALEVQAVYFSGVAMSNDFKAIASGPLESLPFPSGMRRPDYRSSGPKRLMPQLQIKVPSLRRWGKKMAVLVDESFFAALGKMEPVNHLSNCDIAWFVVGYDEIHGRFQLKPRFVEFTTLERAVEGLTNGVPVSLDLFEERIRVKLRDLDLSIEAD